MTNGDKIKSARAALRRAQPCFDCGKMGPELFCDPCAKRVQKELRALDAEMGAEAGQ